MRNSPSGACCEPAPAGECYHIFEPFSPEIVPPFSSWTQASGTWTEESGGYVTTPDDYAQLIWGGGAPTANERFTIISGAVNQQSTRYLFAWEDANNYWFAQVDMDAEDVSVQTVDWTVLIGVVEGGTETILATASGTHTTGFPFTGIGVIVCYRDGVIRVILTDPLEMITYTTSIPHGQFGVGTGDQTGWTDVTIGGWELYNDTRGEGYDPDCGLCPESL